MRTWTVLALAAGMTMTTATGSGAQTAPGGRGEETARQGFGFSVAIADGQVVIGEPMNQDTPGYAYVFAPDTDGTWSQAARLEVPDGADGRGFGYLVAADGATAIVARVSFFGGDGPGSVWVFRRGSSGEWTRVQELTPSDSTDAAGFGVSADIAGDRILVGAFARSDTAGAVYAFARDGTGRWSQTGVLVPDDAEAGDRFGVTLSMDGDRALIAATRKDDQAGAVYVFEADGNGGWKQTARLRPTGVVPGDKFGSSLLLDGDRAFAGAPLHDGQTGAVWGFHRESATGEWAPTGLLQPFDGQPGMGFGSSLTSSGSQLWISAAGTDGQAVVYRYWPTPNGRSWATADRLPTSEPLPSTGQAPVSLSMDGDLAAVGAMGADFGLGAVYVFRRGGGGWDQVAKLFTKTESLAAVSDGRKDCASGQAGGFACDDYDLMAFLPIGDLGGRRGITLNDIWGWTDPETGHEYALVGRSDGTAFVDVTDPASPVFVGQLPLTDGASPNVWRDIKVYRDHAFIVADGAGPHGMQVFDLTRLRDADPAAMPLTFDEDAHYDRIHSAHNIVINEETGFAYAVGASMGGETCGGALHMIDLREPENPTFAGCFADTATGRQKTGYTHDAQCVLYHGPDEEYTGREICFNSSETALGIADVTDKANPRSISVTAYPNVGYTHQGWLTDDQSVFYINDELDEIQGSVEGTRTLVWDVSDLDDPILAQEHTGTQKSSDHNLYVLGDRMYQSNYKSGLRVLDVSDPLNPVEVGWFDTHPQGDNSPGFAGSWSNYPYFRSGTIVVTDVENGLFVLKKHESRPVS
jgi:choice-of-anchor B domain-containing protein